ncbi:MAG: putative holin-like toxin [Acutalibacteraceae bacterium]
MVTYEALFQFTLVIIGVIGLCVNIINNKKK